MSYYNLGNITIENLYSTNSIIEPIPNTSRSNEANPDYWSFDLNQLISEINIQLSDDKTVNGKIKIAAVSSGMPGTDQSIYIYFSKQSLGPMDYYGSGGYYSGAQALKYNKSSFYNNTNINDTEIFAYCIIPAISESNKTYYNKYGKDTGNTEYPICAVDESSFTSYSIGSLKIYNGYTIPYVRHDSPGIQTSYEGLIRTSPYTTILGQEVIPLYLRAGELTLQYTSDATTTTTTTTPLPVQYQSTGTDYICLTNPNITPIPSTFLPCQFFDELEIILDADEVDADGKVTLIFDHNPSGVWGDYLLIYFYGKTTTSTDLVGLAKIPDVTTAGWFDINLYNQTTGALIETQGRIHFVGGLVNATTYYGSCKVQLMAVSNPTTLPDTVNILGAEISLSSYRDSGDEEKTLTILNAINESTTTATTPITIDPIVITPERSIKTIMYEKIGDEFVELEYSDGSDSMNTEKTPFAKAFNFGTIAPGETSKTIIISLYVPYASGINNIKIACINSGGLTFTTTTFGVTTSSELRTDIEPDTYFTGINTSKDATSLFNVSVANNGQYRSEYVYLNIKTPLNNDLITGVVRYVWFIDYSD